MCYMWYAMDITIRNLDEEVYRSFRARAVMERRPVGQVLSDAMRAYLAWAPAIAKRGSMFDLQPFDFSPGNQNLSSEIDAIVYGAER